MEKLWDVLKSKETNILEKEEEKRKQQEVRKRREGDALTKYMLVGDVLKVERIGGEFNQ